MLSALDGWFSGAWLRTGTPHDYVTQVGAGSDRDAQTAGRASSERVGMPVMKRLQPRSAKLSAMRCSSDRSAGASAAPTAGSVSSPCTPPPCVLRAGLIRAASVRCWLPSLLTGARTAAESTVRSIGQSTVPLAAVAEPAASPGAAEKLMRLCLAALGGNRSEEPVRARLLPPELSRRRELRQPMPACTRRRSLSRAAQCPGVRACRPTAIYSYTRLCVLASLHYVKAGWLRSRQKS